MADQAKDPVCGMTVDPKKAKGSEPYGGKTYHFCSISCQQKFKDKPERYARS